MIPAGLSLFPSSRREEDLTCYTSPTSTTIVSWPHGHSLYYLATATFAYIFLAVVVVWMWAHYRPCDTCGEYRVSCRCQSRVY